MDVYLINVHLTGVHLTGVYLVGVYLLHNASSGNRRVERGLSIHHGG